MLNLLIYEKNIYKCKKIINNISKLNLNVKIFKLATTINEIETTLKEYNIDLIIFDIHNEYNTTFLLKSANEKIFLNYNIPTIIIAKELNNFYIHNLKHIVILNNYKLLSNELYHITSNYFNQNKSIKTKISKELDYLCFNHNHIGTLYLIDVIVYIYYDFNTFNNLTKLVYPHISKKYSLSVNTLKCDIFQSTLYSYVNCEQNNLEDYLERSCVEKPSTKNYIYSIIKHIKLGTLKS